MASKTEQQAFEVLCHRIAADAFEQSETDEEFFALIENDPRTDVSKLREITDACLALRSVWIEKQIEKPTHLSKLTSLENDEDGSA